MSLDLGSISATMVMRVRGHRVSVGLCEEFVLCAGAGVGILVIVLITSDSGCCDERLGGVGSTSWSR